MEQSTELPPWLQPQWLQLRQLNQSQRLPHALLLCGASGVGKSNFAFKLAASLLCTSNDDVPCGVCKSCRLFVAETHPDFKRAQPDEGSKVIKVDAVRSVSEFIAHSSQVSGRKVVLITPAECLNVNASNALLKTLEEPTDNSTLILVCNSLGDLLPTIRSRCSLVDFKVPTVEQTTAWLQQQGDGSWSDALIDSALQLSGGAPYKARSYLETNVMGELEQMQKDLAEVLRKAKSVSSLAATWADDIIGERLCWLLFWVEQLIRQRLHPELDWAGQQAAAKMFSYLVEHNDAQAFFMLRQQLLSAVKQIKGNANPNKQLVLESVLGLWLGLVNTKKVA
ncbi:MAG: DNA polymerase III subunit delta' [Oleiphilaceae bacterium]|nr:DNA polymerase III subunit delta' [Oleiphilaceae bacterium]